MIAPRFVEEDWVLFTEDGWKLKPDAPDEIVREFEAFMKEKYGDDNVIVG